MLNIYYILYSKFFLTFSKLWFSQKENLKKYTSFEEHKDTRYIQRNAYLAPSSSAVFCLQNCVSDFFSCLSSTKLCLRFLQLYFVYQTVSQISSAVFCLQKRVSDFFSCLWSAKLSQISSAVSSTKLCPRFLQLSLVYKTVYQISFNLLCSGNKRLLSQFLRKWGWLHKHNEHFP